MISTKVKIQILFEGEQWAWDVEKERESVGWYFYKLGMRVSPLINQANIHNAIGKVNL